MSEALTMDPSGRHELTAHGYRVCIDPPHEEEAGTEHAWPVPAAAHIEYVEGGHSFLVMVGRSPVDGKMVIHLDAEEQDVPLARMYLNDTLIYGTESERTL